MAGNVWYACFSLGCYYPLPGFDDRCCMLLAVSYFKCLYTGAVPQCCG